MATRSVRPVGFRQLTLVVDDPLETGAAVDVDRDEVDLDDLRSCLLTEVYAGRPIPELRAVADRHGLAGWFALATAPKRAGTVARAAVLRRDRRGFSARSPQLGDQALGLGDRRETEAPHHGYAHHATG